MKPSTLWLASSAALISTAILAAPSMPPTPKHPLHPNTKQVKGAQATQQMALSSLLITLPTPLQTNYFRIGFYSGIDYGLNVVTVQSTSDFALGMTNLTPTFLMDDTNVVIQYSSTNIMRFYRIMHNSKFTIAPSIYITNNTRQDNENTN